MASVDYLNPKYYWSHADPRRSSHVWMDNDALAAQKREAEYYRLHPGKADPARLLGLIERIMEAWNGERASFVSTQRELVEQYNRLVDAVNARTDEINRLNEILLRLNKQIERQADQQRRLQMQIDRLQEEKDRSESLARKYLNEAIDAYNSVVADPDYHRFASDKMQALAFVFGKVADLDLDPGAVQGLAVDALSKLFAINAEVIRRRAEFDLAYQVVSTDARDLLAQFEHWNSNVYFDPDGRQNKADMAFWSWNLFPQLYEAAEDICRQLDAAPDNPAIDTPQLKELHKQIEQLREYGSQTVNDVLARSMQSEKAEALGNIASLVLVEDFLFKMVYMGFNDNDERSAYVAQLRSAASGISMQFVFTPLSQSEVGCNYQVCFDGYQDEKRVSDILNAVWHELKPNKINPAAQRDDDSGHIVDHIEFAAPGHPIHLGDALPTLKPTPQP